MAESMSPTPIVRTFLTDAPAATAQASLALMSRRSVAIADYWRRVAEAKQPSELLAVQAGFWSQLLEDYEGAFREGMAQLSASTPNPAALTAAALAPYEPATPSMAAAQPTV